LARINLSCTAFQFQSQRKETHFFFMKTAQLIQYGKIMVLRESHEIQEQTVWEKCTVLKCNNRWHKTINTRLYTVKMNIRETQWIDSDSSSQHLFLTSLLCHITTKWINWTRNREVSCANVLHFKCASYWNSNRETSANKFCLFDVFVVLKVHGMTDDVAWTRSRPTFVRNVSTYLSD